MSDTRGPDLRTCNERGMALVGVLLLLMMMSALGAALTMSGETETLIARNQRDASQAQAAAEAGLNHGAEVTIEYLLDWSENGFTSASFAVDAVLVQADAGSVNGLALDTPHTISADFDAEYQVDIFDDDDTGAGEDGDPLVDQNSVLIIRSTGTSRDGTKVVLEALISPAALPAIVADGNLELTGNTSIEGDGGSVHANDNLQLNGSAAVEVDASASGDINCGPCGGVGGVTTEHAPEIDVPEINASDYIMEADFVLTSTGDVLDRATSALICTAPCMGWEFSAGTWSAEDPAPATTYYVEGDVEIGSNDDLVQVSIIAEGSVNMTANSNWTPDPDAGGLLLVTDGDFYLHGNPNIGTATAEGKILVKGQLDIHGNTTIHGQMVVGDEPVGSLTTTNILQGSVIVSYSGGFSGDFFSVNGWRDVRDAD